MHVLEQIERGCPKEFGRFMGSMANESTRISIKDAPFELQFGVLLFYLQRRNEELGWSIFTTLYLINGTTEKGYAGRLILECFKKLENAV